jgi:hypothetical protein
MRCARRCWGWRSCRPGGAASPASWAGAAAPAAATSRGWGGAPGCAAPRRPPHGLRLLEALSGLEVQAWPHEDPVALREGGTLHVLDGWRYLGAARDEAQAAALLRSGRPAFDLDIHRILRKAMERLGPPIPLDACAGGSAGARATGGAGGARRRTPAAVPGGQPRASVTPPSTTTVSPTTKSPARDAR